jgi:hypothetical protein
MHFYALKGKPLDGLLLTPSWASAEVGVGKAPQSRFDQGHLDGKIDYRTYARAQVLEGFL